MHVKAPPLADHEPGVLEHAQMLADCARRDAESMRQHLAAHHPPGQKIQQPQPRFAAQGLEYPLVSCRHRQLHLL